MHVGLRVGVPTRWSRPTLKSEWVIAGVTDLWVHFCSSLRSTNLKSSYTLRVVWSSSSSVMFSRLSIADHCRERDVDCIYTSMVSQSATKPRYSSTVMKTALCMQLYRTVILQMDRLCPVIREHLFCIMIFSIYKRTFLEKDKLTHNKIYIFRIRMSIELERRAQKHMVLWQIWHFLSSFSGQYQPTCMEAWTAYLL